jgi:hypothetical protein
MGNYWSNENDVHLVKLNFSKQKVTPNVKLFIVLQTVQILVLMISQIIVLQTAQTI